MARVVRTIGMTLNPSAICNHCDWSSPESPSTLNDAKAHCKDRPGHAVVVQRVTLDSYRLDFV